MLLCTVYVHLNVEGPISIVRGFAVLSFTAQSTKRRVAIEHENLAVGLSSYLLSFPNAHAWRGSGDLLQSHFACHIGYDNRFHSPTNAPGY